MDASQAVADSPNRRAPPALPAGRKWLFRMAALALGLLPLLLFEMACLALGWGKPELHDDPLVGFRNLRPLFIPSSDGQRRETAPSRVPWFCHDQFAVPKPAREYRAFVLGGSTVQGHPFARQTAFSTWLEISLAAADDTRAWRFVNCGGVSYATYRLVPILEEVLQYEPDLIILYTGHNEFLEARTFEDQHRGTLAATISVASRLRTFTLLRQGYLHLRGRSAGDRDRLRTILPEEVEALLDYRGGLEQYHRDEAWREGVIRQYAFNLRRMIRICQDRGVDVVLVNPVSKLRDCPPFKAEHAPGLSKAELIKWESLMDRASRELRRGSLGYRRALELYEQARRLDPLHAGGLYNLAQTYDLLGEYSEALATYTAAKDADVCPLRILRPMNEAVLEIGAEAGVPVLDAAQLFARHSDQGIPGTSWLVDHVHPSIEGHQLLANALSELLVSRGVVSRPAADWHALRESRYREHFAALGPLYFERGMQQLKGLTDWAAGRAQQLRPDAADSEAPAPDLPQTSPTVDPVAR